MSRHGRILVAVALALLVPMAAWTSRNAYVTATWSTLAGRVVDPEGRPVAGAGVHVVDTSQGLLFYGGPDNVDWMAHSDDSSWYWPGRNPYRCGMTTTDRQGRFVLRGLKDGAYVVLAVDGERGIQITSHVLYTPRGGSLELRLNPPTYLTGSVRGLDLEPRDGTRILASLSYDRDQTELDAPTFPSECLHVYLRLKPNELDDLRAGPLPAPGRYTFRVSRRSETRAFSATLLRHAVHVTAGETAPMQIDFGKGDSIRGQVLGPRDAPLEHVAVTLTRLDDEGADGAWTEVGDLTNETGQFTVGGITPGRYHLTANRWLPRTGPG